MAVRTAEKGVTDLSQIVAPLLIATPFSYLTSSIERVDEGVEVCTIV